MEGLPLAPIVPSDRTRHIDLRRRFSRSSITASGPDGCAGAADHPRVDADPIVSLLEERRGAAAHTENANTRGERFLHPSHRVPSNRDLRRSVGGRRASQVAGSSTRRRRRGVPQARAVALLTIALTLSAVSSAIAAKTEPSGDETLMTTQLPADSAQKPSKPPKPTKSPKPSPDSPSPEPSPSSEPSPEPSPSPSPSPDPTGSPTHTSSPIPDPSPTSPPGTPPAPPGGGPTASGGAGGDTPLGSGEVPPSSYEAASDLLGGSADQGNTGNVRDGAGSLFATVASIIDELATPDDRAIQAAEAPAACPGSGCGSPTGSTMTRALLIALVCLAIAVAGVLVIRARSRRSTTELPTDRQ